jgi:hypothetical protein
MIYGNNCFIFTTFHRQQKRDAKQVCCKWEMMKITSEINAWNVEIYVNVIIIELLLSCLFFKCFVRKSFSLFFHKFSLFVVSWVLWKIFVVWELFSFKFNSNFAIFFLKKFLIFNGFFKSQFILKNLNF